jgi:2'-5' RNA ligase
VGEFFSSFDDAWAYFLARQEPLEDFFADFPDDTTHVMEGWLVEPTPELKTTAAEIQRGLAQFDFLFPIPDHFLHVWIGLREQIGESCRRWGEIESFSASYGRLNCFHSAVVVEVEDTMRRLVEGTTNDLPTFLPHMTVAVTKEACEPDGVRDALGRLRTVALGKQTVSEVKLVRFPAARSTLFGPWTVLETISLR